MSTARAFRDCPNPVWCSLNATLHLWEYVNERTDESHKRGRVSFCCTRYFPVTPIERMRMLRDIPIERPIEEVN